MQLHTGRSHAPGCAAQVMGCRMQASGALVSTSQTDTLHSCTRAKNNETNDSARVPHHTSVTGVGNAPG